MRAGDAAKTGLRARLMEPMTRSATLHAALFAAATLCLVAACNQSKVPADPPAAATTPEQAFAPPALETIPDGPQGDARARLPQLPP